MPQQVKLIIKNKTKQMVLQHSIGMVVLQILQERDHLHSWGKNLQFQKNLRMITHQVQTKLHFSQLMLSLQQILRLKLILSMKNFSKHLILCRNHFLKQCAVQALRVHLPFVVSFGVIHMQRRQKYRMYKFLWIQIHCQQKS